MVSCGIVRGVALGTVGFDVYGDSVEVRNLVEELVFDSMRELMGFDHVERVGRGDGKIGLESVAFPADSDGAHVGHARDGRCRLFETVDEGGVVARRGSRSRSRDRRSGRRPGSRPIHRAPRPRPRVM
jgi:hypothetical protein